MVTHNPDLANQYATRIIRLLDGVVISDSNPYQAEVAKKDQTKGERLKHTSMSFLTALALSFQNLLTKKARTILTAFAGSIGIIGIALVLALSNGFQSYVDKMQADTLSSYPLIISRESVDFASAAELNMDTSLQEYPEGDTIFINKLMEKIERYHHSQQYHRRLYRECHRKNRSGINQRYNLFQGCSSEYF